MENVEHIKEALDQRAQLFKILSHPVRLCILRMLLERGRSKVSDMQCCMEVSQPSISQHVAKLKAAGLLTGDREGTEIYYRIRNREWQAFLAALLDETITIPSGRNA